MHNLGFITNILLSFMNKPRKMTIEPVVSNESLRNANTIAVARERQKLIHKDYDDEQELKKLNDINEYAQDEYNNSINKSLQEPKKNKKNSLKRSRNHEEYESLQKLVIHQKEIDQININYNDLDSTNVISSFFKRVDKIDLPGSKKDCVGYA